MEGFKGSTLVRPRSAEAGRIWGFGSSLRAIWGALRAWISSRVVVVLALALLAAVGAALRVSPIGANRFHQDEAIYSFWALQIATGRDPILNHCRVDKPPLFIYTLAACFKLFGSSEVVARIPSEMSSLASIGLAYYLASQLYGQAVGVLTAVLMALSPFNILFAPTAFTDPMMAAWILAALCLAARGRLVWSGLALGLAAATKQQGLLFAPLALVIGICCHKALSPSPHLLVSVRRGLRAGLIFALGFLAVMAPVAWWDSLRWRLQPSYLEQSFISYGGLTLVPPAQLVERLGDWLDVLHYITASPVLNILLVGGLPCLLAYDLRRWRGEPATFFDIVLSAFVAFFLLSHWLLSFNIWDRYLLGVVPLLLILLARILWLASRALTGILPFPSGRGKGRVDSGDAIRRGLLVVFLLVATLAGPALTAARSGYPIGGDHGAYDGIEAVATYFRDHAPAGSIVYHYWLGWHYSFYMFDFPLVFRWYPSPKELAEDASQVEGAERYIVFPSDKSTADVREALAEAGLVLYPVHWTYNRDGAISFTIYRIEEQK